MLNRTEDLTGKRFGRLVVLSFIRYEKRQAWWLCQCDCGNQKEIRAISLKDGNTKSCGCFAIQQTKQRNTLEFGLAAKNNLYRLYKSQAKGRNLVFGLDKAFFFSLIQQNCYYCGCEPNQFHKLKSFSSGIYYNGIDRIDNTKGYIVDNCVPCCGDCNKAKNAMSFDQFLSWIKKIYMNMFGE